MPPNGSDTLDDAQAWLRKRVDHGERCPCCTQFAKVYRRKIGSRQAWALITFYRRRALDWGYAPEVLPATASSQSDFSKLRYWGLIESSNEQRDDGGPAGWWRVTSLGEQWVHVACAVPMYARVYDNRCLGLVGDPVTIRDALGTRFNYDDLMRGV
jgi:hypothetical protein